MSLLGEPCTKTSWRALLFCVIFGITGALLVCFDIWRFKQAKNSETGFGGHHCDFKQHVPCLTVHMCMNSMKFVSEASALLFCEGAIIPRQCADSLGGAPLLGRALPLGTLRYLKFHYLVIPLYCAPSHTWSGKKFYPNRKNVSNHTMCWI